MDLRGAAKALLAQYDQMGAYQEIGNLSPEFDALRAALADEVSAWQPIETAPRDGTALLFSEEYRQQAVCCWDDRRRCWGQYAGYAFSGASHWMPLPLPPVLAAHEKEPKDA